MEWQGQRLPQISTLALAHYNIVEIIHDYTSTINLTIPTPTLDPPLSHLPLSLSPSLG